MRDAILAFLSRLGEEGTDESFGLLVTQLEAVEEERIRLRSPDCPPWPAGAGMMQVQIYRSGLVAMQLRIMRFLDEVPEEPADDERANERVDQLTDAIMDVQAAVIQAGNAIASSEDPSTAVS